MEADWKKGLRSTNDRTIDKVEWPRGAQSAVSMTLEIDLNVARDMMADSQAEWTQGEFGARVGIWRVLDLLRRHQVSATFFIPVKSAELYPEIVKAVVQDGHELACHTNQHDDVSKMERQAEKEMLNRSQEALAIYSKHPPVGWRKAVGEISPNTLDLLIDQGFLYIANGMADDIPYWWKIEDSNRRILAIPYSWMFDDALYFIFYPGRETGIQNPSKLLEIWEAEFDASYELGRLFIFTCHSFLIGRVHRLAMLDKFITYVKARPRVWFATCKEVVEYWIKCYPAD
jgi:peptidoglycan/xylan/chitin deacetylase (PgdA/CDA1 family)